MASIRCAHCGGRHESVAEVKACQKGTLAQTPTDTNWDAEMARREAEEQRRVDFTKFGKAPADRPAPGTATLKQVRFIRSLLNDKDIPGHENAWAVGLESELGAGEPGEDSFKPWSLSIKEAGISIDKLLKMPKRANAPANAGKASAVLTEDGIYRNPKTDQIYKVQWNRAGGDGRRLYAKLLVVDNEWERDGDGNVINEGKAHFEYASGAMRDLRPEWKLDRDEAARYGQLYGICVRCSSPLTDEESIAAGLGPICRGKF